MPQIATHLVPQAAALLNVPCEQSHPIVPQTAAQIQNQSQMPISSQLAFGIPWFHHVILIEKVKDRILAEYTAMVQML